MIQEDFYHIKLRSTNSHNVTNNEDDNSVQVEDVDTEDDEDTNSGVLVSNSARDQVRNDVRDQVRDVRQPNDDEAVPILPDHQDANPMDRQPVNSGGNVNTNVNIFNTDDYVWGEEDSIVDGTADHFVNWDQLQTESLPDYGNFTDNQLDEHYQETNRQLTLLFKRKRDIEEEFKIRRNRAQLGKRKREQWRKLSGLDPNVESDLDDIIRSHYDFRDDKREYYYEDTPAITQWRQTCEEYYFYRQRGGQYPVNTEHTGIEYFYRNYPLNPDAIEYKYKTWKDDWEHCYPTMSHLHEERYRDWFRLYHRQELIDVRVDHPCLDLEAVRAAWKLRRRRMQYIIEDELHTYIYMYHPSVPDSQYLPTHLFNKDALVQWYALQGQELTNPRTPLGDFDYLEHLRPIPMCDIWIYKIMKPEQFYGDDHCLLPDIDQFYFTMGRNDLQYSFCISLSEWECGWHDTHDAAPDDECEPLFKGRILMETPPALPPKRIFQLTTKCVEQAPAMQEGTATSRALLAKGKPSTETLTFIVDTGATDTTIPEHLVASVPTVTNLRPPEHPIIVEASNGGTDRIRQVGTLGHHRVQITPSTYKEALLSVDQLIKQHDYLVLFDLNELVLIPRSTSIP